MDRNKILELMKEADPLNDKWKVLVEEFMTHFPDELERFAALIAAEACKDAEPVAWMYDFLNSENRDEVIRNWVTQDPADIEREKGFNVRPLFTHPAPAVDAEPVGQLQEGSFGRGQVMWFKKPADETLLYTHPTPAVVRQLVEALTKAVEWDSHDTEGIKAVWLDEAQAALAAVKAHGIGSSE